MWPASSYNLTLQQFDRSGNRGTTSVRLSGNTRTTNGVATLNILSNDTQSGLRGYDVSIVQDGITRTALATNTLNSQITANGLALGSVYVWEVKASDNVNNASVVTFTVVSARAAKTYYFGASRIAVRDANVLSYLHSDHLSSVSSSTDVNGKVTGVQLFAPYGEMRGSYEQVAGSWGWATHRKAETNGLTFMRARWYVAGVARFAQPDSLIPNPASPQEFNRFVYSRNSPIKINDPTGHCGKGADGSNPCATGQTVTSNNQIGPTKLPKKEPPKLVPTYNGSPDSKKFVVFQFGQPKTTAYGKVGTSIGIDAGVAGAGFDPSLKSDGELDMQAWGKVGVLKVTASSAKGKVEISASIAFSVAGVGVEFNDNGIEATYGAGAAGVEIQSATYVAMSEADYYALTQAGFDPKEMTRKLITSQSSTKVGEPTLTAFGSEVGTVTFINNGSVTKVPYAKLSDGTQVFLNGGIKIDH